MIKVCKGEAFQNEGHGACFETEDFPGDTFHFDNSDEVCSPGVTAIIWAKVNTETMTAYFWAEVDD